MKSNGILVLITLGLQIAILIGATMNYYYARKNILLNRKQRNVSNVLIQLHKMRLDQHEKELLELQAQIIELKGGNKK